MKKNFLIIILFVCIFFLTGCEPKFTYEINDGKLTEQIEVKIKEDISDSDITSNINSYGLGDKDGYVVTIVKEDDYKVVTTTSKVISIDNFFDEKRLEKNIFNRCFDDVYYKYESSESKYYIGTSSGFKCMVYNYTSFDGFDIVFKTNNKVYTHNADEHKWGEYTWHIDSSNAADKKITFVVGNGKYVWYYKYRFLFIGLGAIAALCIIGYIIVAIFRGASNRANSI